MWGSKFGSMSLILWGILFLCPVAQAQTSGESQRPAQRIFLNGESIDDVRDVNMTDMRVYVDAHGNVQLHNSAYAVVRRPGAAVQIVRRAPPAAVGVNGNVFLISERQGAGELAFEIRVHAGGQLVHTLTGSSERQTHEISRFLRKGTNAVRFEAVAVYSPSVNPNAGLRVTIGLGQSNGRMLAIDRVLTRFEGTGRDTLPHIQERVITIE